MTDVSFSVFQPQTSAPQRIDRIWIGSILCLALILRVLGLNSGLWFDEVDTLISYVRLPAGTLLGTYDSLNNHMFFSLQAKASVALFGEYPWALRLPAVILGLGSVWALWRLGRRVAGDWPARLAALLMAVSYHHVWFSQNARGYTGLLFFGLIATIYLMRGAKTPSWKIWLSYGLCFALAMFTHLSAAFLFFAHGVAYLIILLGRMKHITRDDILMPLVGIGAGLALTLVLYAPVLGDMVETFTGVAAGPVSQTDADSIAQWANPLWMLSEMAGAFGAFGPLAIVILPVTVLVLIWGSVLIARVSLVLALILPIHLVTTTALLVIMGFRVWPRYFIIDIGLICLVLIVGAIGIGGFLAALLRRKEDAVRAGLILASLGIIASLVLLPKNYLAPKQDYVGATAYVNANRPEGSEVIALGLGHIPFDQYYAPDWKHARTADDLAALPIDPDNAWIVYTFPKVVERRLVPVFERFDVTHEKERYFHGTLAGGGIVVLRPK